MRTGRGRRRYLYDGPNDASESLVALRRQPLRDLCEGLREAAAVVDQVEDRGPATPENASRLHPTQEPTDGGLAQLTVPNVLEGVALAALEVLGCVTLRGSDRRGAQPDLVVDDARGPTVLEEIGQQEAGGLGGCGLGTGEFCDPAADIVLTQRRRRIQVLLSGGIQDLRQQRKDLVWHPRREVDFRRRRRRVGVSSHAKHRRS
jgi:hypothetical protein